jgi:hypothetical protein
MSAFTPAMSMMFESYVQHINFDEIYVCQMSYKLLCSSYIVLPLNIYVLMNSVSSLCLIRPCSANWLGLDIFCYCIFI